MSPTGGGEEHVQLRRNTAWGCVTLNKYGHLDSAP